VLQKNEASLYGRQRVITRNLSPDGIVRFGWQNTNETLFVFLFAQQTHNAIDDFRTLPPTMANHRRNRSSSK
jgi:hypothetical protein